MATKAFQLRSILLGDRPEAWSALGFELATPPSGSGAVATLCLGNTTIGLTGSTEGFLGWRIEGIKAPLDGLSTATGSEAWERQTPTLHPNGIDAIDHVVLNTGDVPRTVDALAESGVKPSGGRSTTSYGSPMAQVFFWLGDVILELVGPDEGEPTTSDPCRLFGLALVAPNLDSTVAALGDLAGQPKDAVQSGRRIAGIRGNNTGVSLPLAVMSPHVPVETAQVLRRRAGRRGVGLQRRL
jgi:hypothetical protein